MFGFLNGVVTQHRVKLRSFGVVGGSSVRSGVILSCLGCVVPGRSAGCSIENWSLGLAFRFNVVRISSCLGGVVLRCLGGVVLRCLGGVVLRCLGGVVFRCLGG
jgi:hypothetical protein